MLCMLKRVYVNSVVGTLLNTVGKMKDTDKARLDLHDVNIRKELYLQIQGKKLVKLIGNKGKDRVL